MLNYDAHDDASDDGFGLLHFVCVSPFKLFVLLAPSELLLIVVFLMLFLLLFAT